MLFLTAYCDDQTVERAARTWPLRLPDQNVPAPGTAHRSEVALCKVCLERTLRKSKRWLASVLRGSATRSSRPNTGGLATGPGWGRFLPTWLLSQRQSQVEAPKVRDSGKPPKIGNEITQSPISRLQAMFSCIMLDERQVRPEPNLL